MVGKLENLSKMCKLEDVLTEKQVQDIIRKCLGDGDWRMVDYDIRPATEGLAGFLGDHKRATLHVASGAKVDKIQLFIKRVPQDNKPKADFINSNNFYNREALMFRLIDELRAADDPKPWCAKALVYTETLLVMPDLRPQGYSVHSHLETLDLPHAMAVAESVGRFHAAITNYETKCAKAGLPGIYQQHAQLLEEPNFNDSPWLRCAAKLNANLLKVFSKKYNDILDLESRLVKLYIEACDGLKEHKNTLNVLLHKDLWVNNMMFRYEKGVPVNALLIDFQCVRYGPPAFDMMAFLYLGTSRSFREQFELKILNHYFAIFLKHVDEETKHRLRRLGYDEEQFLGWCEKARMFGALVALSIFPYILMDPIRAQSTYDDPETYERYLVEDRTAPVVAHCRESRVFRDRQMELSEEFVERYVEKQ